MLYIKNPQIFKAVKAINLAMIMFIIHNKGFVSVEEVEVFTDLKKVSNDIVAGLLGILVKEKKITITDGMIHASVTTLKKIMRDEQIKLPAHYGHPWSDADYIKLAELSVKGTPVFTIAKELKRTEQSVITQSQLLRKAYKLIELVKNNPIVLEFVKTSSFPNPVIDNHTIGEDENEKIDLE